MIKKKKQYQFVFFALTITILIIWGAYHIFIESEEKNNNPYEYNIKEYMNIESSKVLFNEIQKIPLIKNELYAIAVDNEDNFYVAADSSLIKLNKEGESMYEFPLDTAAHAVSIDSNQSIYCGMGDHLEIYDSSGNQKSIWASLGERAMITSIAIFKDHVFIADYGNRLVWHFDSSGRLKRQIGRAGQSRDKIKFILPSPYFDLAVSPKGTLFVTNPGKLRIEEFTFNGEQISFWGDASMSIEGFAGCCNPTHIFVRDDGSIITSEKGIPRIKLYTQSGQFIGVVATPDMFSEDTDGLDCVENSQGHIIVLDPKAKVVRVFSKKIGMVIKEERKWD